jgi:alkylation response protein AidB-like acyl-CoA dehydrogenase
MDFRLDEEQTALQDAVRRCCAARYRREDLGRREGRRVDRDDWRALADLGVFGVLVPASQGGLGLGAVAAAIVFEQLGAHLVDGPLLWTALAATHVDGAASGERLVGGVEHDAASADPVLVEHAADADALLVLRSDGLFLLAGEHRPVFTPIAPLDPLTPVARAAALPEGARIGDGDDATRVRQIGTVLSAALQLGLADAALDAARAYALAREQFGAPIGSFQAVQHVLADMYVRTTLARGAVYAAAAALDDPAVGDARRAGAAAKLLAGEAAVDNARAAIQVHGGMGFTWEMPTSYLLKRAWVLEQSFGDAGAHALALGRALEDDAA